MKADFAMALHFHQPVGNFDHVIERACDKCYIPFLETLKKYPEIKMTFHFTGCLLEWTEKHRPVMIDTVRDMVKSGQVEIMSGGFYEPILPSIPEGDRVRQIRMLSEYAALKLLYEPKGAWTAERVWEPDLPSFFHDAGIKYTILDETHLLYSGIPKDRTYGYYFTENAGKSVAVLPSDKILRYFMPFRMPEESMDYMKGVVERMTDPTFIYGDDGEKFGEWPGTHKWVFEEKWLEKFFDALMDNRDWLQTVHCAEILDKKQALGRVYLPTSSYDEMLEWALPVASQRHFEEVMNEIRSSGREDFYKPFIRGGFWRNFLAKYPESNHMNKKMAYVSKKLGNLPKNKTEKTAFAEAEKDLFRGQCNCAYWHGVFGGLYLFHLRNSVYYHLIKSEAAIDRIRHGSEDFCEAEKLDFDGDGIDEAVLSNKEISIVIDPAEGGAITELDSKTVYQNLSNVLTRREEAYHDKIKAGHTKQEVNDLEECKTIHDNIQAASSDVKESIVYDRHDRYGLIDHFLEKKTDVRSFSRCAYKEAGDFIKAEYDLTMNRSKGGVSVSMKRKGHAGGVVVEVKKDIFLPEKGSCAQIKYSIENKDSSPLEAVFAVEFNLAMPSADSDRYRLVFDGKDKGKGLNDTVSHEKAKEVKISDSEGQISFGIKMSRDCGFWHFPVKTVSQSEKAYELNYQGSAVLPVLPVQLKSGEKTAFTVSLNLV